MAIATDLSQANQLLAALPSVERSQVLAECELAELKTQALLLQAGQALEHAWFPVEGFACLVLPLDDAAPLHLGLVGNEGMWDTAIALGAPHAALSIVVQGQGRAWRIGRHALQCQMERLPLLRRLLLGYAEVRHRQLARQAACLKHHSVEQRLARALLMARDRAHATELFLTHDALAQMLGARRESVSHAARHLHLRGQISYSRGYMMLLDEAALALDACACYGHDLHTYRSWWSGLGAAELL